jgi:hypothetical protein
MKSRLSAGAVRAGAAFLILLASLSLVPSATARKQASVQKELKDTDRGKLRRTVLNPGHRSLGASPPPRKHSPLTMPK